MAQQTYSVYEAKAKLSEILRAVKQKRRVTITERGIPVAEVVPYLEKKTQTADERYAELLAQGAIIPAEQYLQ